MSFNIIHHHGTPKDAVTLHNEGVHRQETLFVVEWNVLVPVAPYDDHFIYECKDPGAPSYMCTCGSAAVVIFPEAEQRMFVCMYHASNGVHATGGKLWQ